MQRLELRQRVYVLRKTLMMLIANTSTGANCRKSVSKTTYQFVIRAETQNFISLLLINNDKSSLIAIITR